LTIEPSAPQTYSPPPPLSPSDERSWAMIAHLSVLVNLISGFFGPIAALVIYMIYKDRSRYVAFHAMQSFVFQLVWWVGGGILAGITWAIGGALTAVVIGLLCLPIACVFSFMPMVALIYGIIGGIQTNQGQDFKYWLIGDWVRSNLVK